MGQRDLTNINEKLDKILFFMGTTEQHFKELNGTIKRHEAQFVIQEKKLTEICNAFDTKVDNVEKIALGNKGQLIKYGGIAIGLSLVFALGGFALTCKNLFFP